MTRLSRTIRYDLESDPPSRILSVADESAYFIHVPSLEAVCSCSGYVRYPSVTSSDSVSIEEPYYVTLSGFPIF